MALINCKECNEKVSDKAGKCPKCGIKLKKKTNPFSMILFGVITVFFIVFLLNRNSKSEFDYRINKTNNSLEKSKVSVENVHINKENKYAWAVEGMVKNKTSSNIKGYVKIKFLNSSGDITYTTMTKVNDGDYFKSWQSANFDYYTEPSNFDGVIDFDIIFVER
jgi:biopolymer transport protein ExbD